MWDWGSVSNVLMRPAWSFRVTSGEKESLTELLSAPPRQQGSGSEMMASGDQRWVSQPPAPAVPLPSLALEQGPFAAICKKVVGHEEVSAGATGSF